MAIESLRRPSSVRAHRSVRVDRDTYDRLVEVSREANIPLTRLIARALDVYDRVTMAEESNAAYARLREDPEAWADWQSELAVWDTTLLDGLAAAR
ncbi:MAG TPA: toxin-antitoxin system protein [Chloroflexota bacterium]|nr:toxin-antitoxin system protein [Chloroflexota bacterium]